MLSIIYMNKYWGINMSLIDWCLTDTFQMLFSFLLLAFICSFSHSHLLCTPSFIIFSLAYFIPAFLFLFIPFSLPHLLFHFLQSVLISFLYEFHHRLGLYMGPSSFLFFYFLLLTFIFLSFCWSVHPCHNPFTTFLCVFLSSVLLFFLFFLPILVPCCLPPDFYFSCFSYSCYNFNFTSSPHCSFLIFLLYFLFLLTFFSLFFFPISCGIFAYSYFFLLYSSLIWFNSIIPLARLSFFTPFSLLLYSVPSLLSSLHSSFCLLLLSFFLSCIPQ